MWRRGAWVLVAGLYAGSWGVIGTARAQIDTAWARQYSGTGAGSNIPDAMELDPAGHVYVTGRSWNGETFDYVTLKYSANGSLEWERRYTGAAEFGNEAAGIEIDAGGDICITGANTYGSERHGYCVLRYDVEGNLLWEQWRSWPAHGPAHIHSVRVDSEGAVHIVGQDGTDGSKSRYFTMKFSPTGRPLWQEPFGEIDGPVGIATALKTDGAGNVYVTGQSWNRGVSSFLTIKYNSSGDMLWKDRCDGHGGAVAMPKAIAVSRQGTVYVTGCIHSKGPDCDILTVKYTRDGRRAWVRTFSTSSRSPDRVCALALDSLESVYIAGYSRGETADFDYITLKYNSQGEQQWERRYNGPSGSRDEARAVAVDNSGNVYVTGASWLAGVGYNFLTVKYLQSTVLPR